MSQILVRNLSPETVDRLKAQAKRNKRSLEAEVRSILDEAASSPAQAFSQFKLEIAEGRNKVAAFRDFLDKTRIFIPNQTTDSTELIRQARDELDAKAYGDLRR
jgi:plasmid stability protein